MLRWIRSNALLLLVALSALWVGCGLGRHSRVTPTTRGDTVMIVQHIRTTDTVYQRQHDTMVVYQTRWRQRIDSILRTDTVPLSPRESTIIRSGDSAINACSVVVLTCEERVAQRDSLADSLRLQVKDLTKISQHRVDRKTVAVIGALGLLAGMLVK